MYWLHALALTSWLFIFLYISIQYATERFAFHPEISRKLLHIGMGLVCCFLPFLFTQNAPVAGLGLLTATAMVILRVAPNWDRTFGSVLNAVGRRSWGEFAFITAVCSLFALSHDNYILYLIPLLTLVSADSIAALISTGYGRMRFATLDGVKSVEGSIAFFATTFLCVHVPLLLGTSVDRLQCLLIAAIIAFLVMLLEDVSWGGWDNIAVPIASYILLRSLLNASAEDLLVRLAVLGALVMILVFVRRSTTLDDDALSASALFGYVLWILGGWTWLIAPTALLLRDALPPVTKAEGSRRHAVEAIACVCLPGLAWGILAALSARGDFFYPYMLTFAVHGAMFERLRQGDARTRGIAAACAATLLMMLAYVACGGSSHAVLWRAAIGFPLSMLAASAFRRFQPHIADCPCDLPRWLRQGGAAFLASLAGAAAFMFMPTR